MGDTFKHQIFFEAHCLRGVEKKTIVSYFSVRRKSGGGECGDLQPVKDDVYRLSFKHREDQIAVLRNPQHVVKCGEKDLVLTVRESLEEQTARPTEEPCASPVKIQSPNSSSSAEADQRSTEDGSSVLKKQIIHLAEAKRRLLWVHIEKSEQFSELKASQGDVGEIVLEGSEEEIQKAADYIKVKEKLVLVRSVPEISPHLLAFLKNLKPGVLEDALKIDDEVELDLEGTELKLYSLSSDKLSETETLLRGGFKEVNTDVSAKVLRRQLENKVNMMNQEDMRVQITISSDGKICLSGYAKEVDELIEHVTKFKKKQQQKNKKRNNQKKLDKRRKGSEVLQPPELQEKTPSFLEDEALEFPLSPASSVLYSPASKETFCPKPSALEKVSSDIPGCIEGVEGTVFAKYHLQEELILVVCHGDITKQCADALVNATNESLDHTGGGVSAALSKAGGPQVQAESRDLVKKLGRIPAGEVAVTNAGNLKCKKLLHAVGPVDGQVGGKEKVLLQKIVHTVLGLSEEEGFQSIAMPCISSGSCGVPLSVSSEAIITAIEEFGRQGGRSLRRIVLIDNRVEAARAIQRTCDEILQGATASGATKEFRTQTDHFGGATAGADVDRFHVEVVHENIEDQQSDAVVCPMVGHNPTSTRIGSTLSGLEGPELARRFYKEERTFPGDTVLVEGLSALPSKAVVYVHLAPWDDDPSGTAVEVLKMAMTNILNVCEKRGFKSIALPALGVGAALRFPEEVASRVLFEELYGHKWLNTHTTPLLVRVVIHPSDQKSSRAFQFTQEHFQQTESFNPTPQPTHEPPLRIALLGKTGVGKSSLANTIFGEELFTTDHTPLSETRKCQAETRSVQDKIITLVDTPGFFDTDKSEEELKPEIMRLITECSPGPHAIFIVLKVEKFTEQEQDVVSKILQYFTEEVLKYTVVVFTHGNQLPQGMSIEEFVSQSKPLSELLKRCDNRCHVVDNTYWQSKDEYRNNHFQVGEILNTVADMVKSNNGAYHSNAMFELVEKEIESQVVLLNESAPNLPQEEIRKKARKIVSDKFLINLTGVTIGILLGAFFGVGTLMSSPLLLLFKTIVKGPGSVIGLAATVVDGAVKGGCVGFDACQNADSPKEAAEDVLQAFMSKGRSTKGALK